MKKANDFEIEHFNSCGFFPTKKAIEIVKRDYIPKQSVIDLVERLEVEAKTNLTHVLFDAGITYAIKKLRILIGGG